jgi:hypothetical protein
MPGKNLQKICLCHGHHRGFLRTIGETFHNNYFKNAKPNPYGIAYRLKSHLRQRSAGRCGSLRNWKQRPARDD